MATLEKIRSKSVFLLVIIGLALLAFILTDFLTSGRTIFGSGTTVAQVEGQKVDVMELQKRVEQQSQNMQAQGKKVDMSELQAQVLDQMVTEALLNAELDRLGITVTDNELQSFMMGEGSSMVDTRVSQLTGGQIASVSQLYDMLGNPQKYQLDNAAVAQLNALATQLESDVEEQLKMMKFSNLFTGAITANKLDAESYFNDGAATAHIAYARAGYDQVPDDQVTVTDEEIQQEWERTRNRYRLGEESRTVSYLTVPIVPSSADYQAAQAKVEEAVAALAGAEGAQGLDGRTEFVTVTERMPASKIADKKVKAFLDSAAPGAVRLVGQNGNDYTVAKLNARSAAIDSVLIDFLFVEGAAQRDSLLGGLKGGQLTPAQAYEAAAQHQDSLWVSLFDPNVAGLKEQLQAATAGEWWTPDSAMTEGGRLFRVRTRRAEVPVFDYVTAVFTAEPSAATVNTLMADLTKFLADNKTAKAFEDNAPKAGYTLEQAVVSPSSVHIGNLPDSRGAVRWVMKDAKAGQVSDIFGNEETGRFLVVAVDNIYTGDFVPASEPRVREVIVASLTNDKKAEQLIKKYQGKASDIAGYAAAMGVSVDSTTVNFNQPAIPRLGQNESKLQASVAAAKPGKVVSPVQTSTGVVAFVVTDVDQAGRPFDFTQDGATWNRSRGGQALTHNMRGILQGRSKVKNRSLEFFRE